MMPRSSPVLLGFLFFFVSICSLVCLLSLSPVSLAFYLFSLSPVFLLLYSPPRVFLCVIDQCGMGRRMPRQ